MNTTKLEPENNQKIISNNLDQAPKTHAAGYGKRVDEMRQDIIDAMNREFFVINEKKDKEKANKRINENIDNSIKDQIIEQLKKDKKIAYLYNETSVRGKYGKETRHRTISGPIPEGNAFEKLGKMLTNNKILYDGHIYTFLIFERNEYGQIGVGFEQLEFLPLNKPNAEEIACHKELNFREFKDFMGI